MQIKTQWDIASYVSKMLSPESQKITSIECGGKVSYVLLVAMKIGY